MATSGGVEVSIAAENAKMVGKLAIVALGMFAFGYVLIPIYKHICELTGINILSLSERRGARRWWRAAT